MIHIYIPFDLDSSLLGMICSLGRGAFVVVLFIFKNDIMYLLFATSFIFSEALVIVYFRLGLCMEVVFLKLTVKVSFLSPFFLLYVFISYLEIENTYE